MLTMILRGVLDDITLQASRKELATS